MPTLPFADTGDVVATPFGLCAIVDLADADVPQAWAALPAAERARADSFAGARRRDFIAGRTAMHRLVADDVAILSDDRGAPKLPPGRCGSISHKASRAVAIVAPVVTGYVGIDLERAVAPRGDIGRRILTPREPAVTGKWLTRVFAIKEAIYKAIDPLVRRYVGFHEIEVGHLLPRPPEADAHSSCAEACDGTAVVVDAQALPVRIEFWCIERDGYWLAAARGNAR